MRDMGIDQLLCAREDVPAVVAAAVDCYEHLVPGNPGSESTCRESAINSIHSELGQRIPPEGYSRWSFVREAALAARILSDEIFEIRWSSPQDWVVHD